MPVPTHRPPAAAPSGLTDAGQVKVSEQITPRVRRRAFELEQRFGIKEASPERLVAIAIERFLAEGLKANAAALNGGKAA